MCKFGILGHGVDLVDIAEIERWIDDPRNPFLPRCFVQEELDEVGNGPDRIQSLAGRFAIKEAVMKALGTGFGDDVAFSDVITHREPGGPPTVKLTGGAAQSALKRGITEWRLSISHTDTLAMASAIAIGETHHGHAQNRD